MLSGLFAGVSPKLGLSMLKKAIESKLGKPVSKFSIHVDISTRKLQFEVGNQKETADNEMLFTTIEALLASNLPEGATLEAASITQDGERAYVTSYMTVNGEKVKSTDEL